MRYFLMILLLLASPVLALDADEMFDDPALEERARTIGRELRCLKCRNQSIFDSNAGIAKDLRVVVRERITAGDSDRQILDYVQARFGDYVLLKPPFSGHTYALWLTPFLLAVLGAGGLALFLRRRGSDPGPDPLSEEDRASAQALLKEKL